LIRTPFKHAIALYFKIIEYKLTDEQLSYIENELPKRLEMIELENRIKEKLILDFNEEKKRIRTEQEEVINRKNEEINEIKIILDSTVQDFETKLLEVKIKNKELNIGLENSEMDYREKKASLQKKLREETSKFEKLENKLKIKENEINELSRIIDLKQEKFNMLAADRWLEENEELINEKENIKLATNTLANKHREISEELNLLTDEKVYMEGKITSLKTKSKEYLEDLKDVMGYVNQKSNKSISEKSILEIDSIQLIYDEDTVIDTIPDYINDLSDNLIECGIGIEHSRGVAEYIYATFINNMGLLLVGYNSRKIANGISSLTCGMTANILSLPLGFNDSKELITSVNNSESKVILIENAVDNISESIYLPLIKQNTDKLLIFSIESKENIHLLSNSLFNYLTVLNIDPILDFENQGEIIIAITEQQVFEMTVKKDKKYNADLENLDRITKFSKVTKHKMSKILNSLEQIDSVDPLFSLINYSILLLSEKNNRIDDLNKYIEGLSPETANRLQKSKEVRV
jgi:hypothetical protein